MGAGKIIGGIVLLVVGVIIFGFSSNINSIQSNNIQKCNSLTGQLGQSLSQQNTEICSHAPGLQSFSMSGMLLGGLLALIGVILAIVGAIVGNRKKPQPQQQFQPPPTTPQDTRVDTTNGSNNDNNPTTPIVDELAKLANLKEQGVITESEFLQMKQDLIRRK